MGAGGSSRTHLPNADIASTSTPERRALNNTAVLLETTIPTFSLLGGSADFMSSRDPEAASLELLHKRNYHGDRYKDQQATSRKPQQYCVAAIHCKPPLV
jgi:hypothetical protein